MMKLCSPHNAPVILASASPRRVALLAQLGLVPDSIIPADINEDNFRSELPTPYARRMAREKAERIAQDHPGAFVIGADTVVACGRRILPKAETAKTAEDCMDLLMGRSHRVYGGIALVKPLHAVPDEKRTIVKLSHSHVTMRRLDQSELRDYIEHGDWDGKAGGYAIQGAAAQYITKISGSYSQIMGLDIYLMANMLKSAGFISQSTK